MSGCWYMCVFIAGQRRTGVSGVMARRMDSWKLSKQDHLEYGYRSTNRQVVAYPSGNFGKKVGRTGCDHHQIRPASQLFMSTTDPM